MSGWINKEGLLLVKYIAVGQAGKLCWNSWGGSGYGIC